LSTHQIEYCFPVSEDKVVIITINKVASLWNLQPIKPVCDEKLTIYDRFPTFMSSGLYRVRDHFLIGNQLIKLKDLSNIEQGFDFVEYSHIKTVGSFVCGIEKDAPEIHLFSLNEFGLLEKKWDFKVDKGLIESKWGPILSLKIESMNEDFIILSSWHKKAVNLFVVNMNGELVDFISKDIVGESIEYSKVWAYPIFAHISDNILIFKHPQQHTLYFWHIPTKACISEFEWTKTFYDLALYCDKAKVQDIHFADGKLTILLTTEHVEGSNRPAQFRVIQFDPLHTIPSGLLLGLVSRIFATLKGLYYAVPGKNPT
jgi:hypothetical protein